MDSQTKAKTALERSVADGSSWEAFCDQLRATGRQVQRAEAASSPLDQAEGYRYLARIARTALETFVEFNDPEFPVIYRPSDEIIKIGGDNPDNCYQKCVVDAKREYRIRGRRNTVYYLSFISQGNNYGKDGTMLCTGFLDGNDLEVEADGRFEIHIGCERRSGNWLPLTEQSQALLIRQTFAYRDREQLADLEIECLDAGAAPAPLEAAQFARNLAAAGQFFDGTVRLFCDWSAHYQEHRNQLPLADQELCQRVGGDPNILYYNSYWQLAPDEALVVELDSVPDCEYWNFQLCNYWLESLDYRYYRIHLNKFTATANADGSVRIVVAHRDPGVANWLSTAGHDCGTMLFRWVGLADREGIVHPQTRVVAVDSLAASAVATDQ